MDNTCPRCGSTKRIPDLPISSLASVVTGQAEGAGGHAAVLVRGAPQAWILKEPVPGLLRVRICGECGHADLHALNFRDLYEAYEKSRQS